MLSPEWTILPAVRSTASGCRRIVRGCARLSFDSKANLVDYLPAIPRSGQFTFSIRTYRAFSIKISRLPVDPRDEQILRKGCALTSDSLGLYTRLEHAIKSPGSPLIARERCCQRIVWLGSCSRHRKLHMTSLAQIFKSVSNLISGLGACFKVSSDEA
jgi:hypothetical protein